MLLINQNLKASRVAYSLTCSTGNYAVTGQNATFTLAKKLNVANGSYNVTGQNATLTLAKKLTANVGQYAVTGQNATFTLAKKLTVNVGHYAVTGQNATLSYVAGGSAVAYSLSCEAGSYNVAGQAAQLIFTPAIMEIISRGGFKAKTEYKDKRKEVEADIARAIEKVTGVPKVLAKTVEIEPVNIPSKVQELVMQAQITALQIEIAQLTEAELDDEEILMLLL